MLHKLTFSFYSVDRGNFPFLLFGTMLAIFIHVHVKCNFT